MSYEFGNLTFQPALKHKQLIALPTKTMLENWQGKISNKEFLVSEIDPEFSDTIAFCTKYNVDPGQTANCLVIEARRGANVKYVGCLVPANAKANINNVIRRFLDARSASMASREFVITSSKMEYGGITIIGLPADWQLLIDEKLVHIPYLLIGSGLRKSKLLIPGQALQELPNSTIIEGLSICF